MIQKVMMRFAVLVLLIVSVPAVAEVTGLPDFTSLVEKSGPAVVNIHVTKFGTRSRQNDRQGSSEMEPGQQGQQQEIPPFLRRYFGVPGSPGGSEPDQQGTGSGFIYTADGYVMTNHHVIEGADQIIVRLADRREFEAELIGSDEASDIAVLKITDNEKFAFLHMGNSDELKAGQWVAAIGSPFNFEQSVTAGIVSAKGRTNGAQQYVPFIQTDVAINRGNSGGPLLDMNGDVVGVNSWILSSNGGYIGLSFSIPIEVAESTARQLLETGKVERGLLGVVVGVVTREMAEALDLDRPVGALVNEVSKGGSADRAGIEAGDVILAFNGAAVDTWNDLPPLVGANPPGTEAQVEVSREGKIKTFDVTLDSLNSEDGVAIAEADTVAGKSNALGLAVESINADRRRELGDPKGGVVITAVESDAAWRAGLRPGDVILMINRRDVGGMSEFSGLIEDVKPGKAVALHVWRDGTSSFIAYTPADKDKG